MTDITVYAKYGTLNPFDVIIHVTDYDYTPEQKEIGPRYDSGGEPGYPESAEPTEGWVELDMENCEFKRFFDNQVNDGTKVFEELCNKYRDKIEDTIIDYHDNLDYYDDDERG